MILNNVTLNKNDIPHLAVCTNGIIFMYEILHTYNMYGNIHLNELLNKLIDVT